MKKKGSIFPHYTRSSVVGFIFSIALILFLFVTPAYSAEVSLAWDPNTETDVAGYKIHYGFESRNYTLTADVGNQTSYTLSDLEPGKVHYFAVTAYNGAGESAYSNEVSGVPQSSDLEMPTITITSPTSASTYSTTEGAISIGGSASDNVGVTSVTWANNLGGSGTASGTDTWTISSVPLQVGDNIISVTSYDVAGNSGSDTFTVTYTLPDTTNPAVTITSPTSASTYSTTEGAISIGGSASDNVGVTSVTWANNLGGSGTASGTDTWTISSVPLQVGDNIISVTSYDVAGNSGSDTFTVNYILPGTYTEIFGDVTDTDYPGTLEDTYLNLNEENTSTSESLNTYTWPQDMAANAIVMKWDLSAIPSSATIRNARLYLYMSNIEGTGGDDLYDLSAHMIINYDPVISACTGNHYDGINSWTPNGRCYDNIPLAQADIVPAEDTQAINKTYDYKSWSITNMVKEWVSHPDLNYGVLINSDLVAGSNSNRYFSSTESSIPDQRPKLVITYSIGDFPAPPKGFKIITN